MHLQIDNSSDRPVYLQIIDHIKRDIALAQLIKGDKLPTVRQLAAQLVINPNTIAKAYRHLEQEGIIATRPGSGAFVAQLDSNLSLAVREKIISQQLERATIDAVHMQINRATLGEWFDATMKKFNLK
jgi:GntR family transcriptional regulator